MLDNYRISIQNFHSLAFSGNNRHRVYWLARGHVVRQLNGEGYSTDGGDSNYSQELSAAIAVAAHDVGPCYDDCDCPFFSVESPNLSGMRILEKMIASENEHWALRLLHQSQIWSTMREQVRDVRHDPQASQWIDRHTIAVGRHVHSFSTDEERRVRPLWLSRLAFKYGFTAREIQERETLELIDVVASRIETAANGRGQTFGRASFAVGGSIVVNPAVLPISATVAIRCPPTLKEGDTVGDKIQLDGRQFKLTKSQARFIKLAIQSPSPMSFETVCKKMGWDIRRQTVDNQVARVNERLKRAMRSAPKTLHLSMDGGLQFKWVENHIRSNAG
jgi:hypothetical protein